MVEKPKQEKTFTPGVHDENGRILPEVKTEIKRRVRSNLLQFGYDWNKSELAREFKVSIESINQAIEEILNLVRDNDYGAMQIMRLEQSRQLLLEELEQLRNKGRPRSHIISKLSDVEVKIAEMRRKEGYAENREVINLKTENTNVNSHSFLDADELGKILERDIQNEQRKE